MEPLTDVEKEAVSQLKASLPEITKCAQVPENYQLWNIALDKESTDSRLDVLLVKFLRARNLDLVKATKMLTDTLIWRKDFKTDELLDETFDESLFSSVGYLYKTDKKGRPVCYNFYGDIDQEKVFADVNKFIRWRVQLMEKGIQQIDLVNVDSMIVIHDYKGASVLGRTQNAKTATKEIIKIMQDNYPEFLATKFFVNVPWWGSTIFKLVRPLLSEATVKKFVVCSNDELYSNLTKLIPEENLADTYRSYAPKKKNLQESELKETSVKEEQHVVEEKNGSTTETEKVLVTPEPIKQVAESSTAATATKEN
ncbi:hypothetical protein G6F46_010764 [Rhizopus delemar]|uniref:CRAL-TRIO domain-containing protein n=3 Tax=Rhizopus TaxID=4842 RepID=I1BXL1_RHIO9|nr:hypothetical protein RO3G_05646 [Rhizopus delemar RA 99-880]KAG1454201.1 hypothetical protein G6F55_007732 [Rhizopus delemar]KAG1539606.1 hypothetical protein G6F51_009037 [Rhizopus arrhizus]KAG1503284.1 hypothetical protein G6F54_001775 [Rhizopus delemar]KAG1507907.1 hypothetical protein G6F53_008592 [Rhizopus delemar]|eukprot:EIE80941.1 hypothetical protein RO3G_05646 [Rhizopus delemar RA 99-880]